MWIDFKYLHIGLYLLHKENLSRCAFNIRGWAIPFVDCIFYAGALFVKQGKKLFNKWIDDSLYYRNFVAVY